ncbi:MAG: transglycosylase SLT domain-containing protein [Lysobacterales bacterium]
MGMARCGCGKWLLVLALSGCAGQTPREFAPAPVPADAVNQAGLAFEQAVEAWVHGLGERPEDGLASARSDLQAAVTACVQQARCDHTQAVDAQARALERLQQALFGRSSSDEVVVEQDGEEGLPAAPLGLTDGLPEVARSAALLKGRRLDQVIQLNGAVKAGIEDWLTSMRSNLLDAYENYQYLRYRMWPVYENAGLPEALLFGMVAKESGGKVHAVSRAGAAGLLQFMPATASRYGLSRAGGFDERFDAVRITEANVAYLNDQFRRFNNDLELVLAAYNGGENRLSRLAGNGRHGFWDAPIYNALPPETRDYVPMVLAAAWLFLHPEEYGLDFPEIDPTPASIILERASSLSELSVCMGQSGNPRGWFRTLRNLNPRYLPDTPIAAGSVLDAPRLAADAYAARCRSGQLAERSAELHAAERPHMAGRTHLAQVAAGARLHTVSKGETLHSIARRFGCAVGPLAAANRLRPPRYLIRIGQRLQVPACG